MDEAEGLPVRPAHLVGEVQPLRHLGGDVERQRLGHNLPVGRQLFGDDAEVVPFDVLEDDEVFAALGNSEIVNLDDVAMGERRMDARFREQHVHEAIVGGQVRQDPLDGDELLEALRADHAPLEHLGHAADGDWLEQLVLAEFHEGRSPSVNRNRDHGPPRRSVTAAAGPLGPRPGLHRARSNTGVVVFGCLLHEPRDGTRQRLALGVGGVRAVGAAGEFVAVRGLDEGPS